MTTSSGGDAGNPWGQQPEGAGSPAPELSNPPLPSYPAQPYGAQPYGTEPYGAQQYGTQPYGAQQYGAQPYGAQPYETQQQYAAPQQPYGQAPGYPMPPAAPYGAYPQAPMVTGTNGLAIGSLVTSCFGFLYGLSAIVGIILGIIALNQIKQTGQQGRGLAIAGIVVGGAWVALFLILVVGLVVVGINGGY